MTKYFALGQMHPLAEFLFPAPALRRAGAILRWWESRRLAYNLIVGGAGLVSLGAVNLLTALPPGGRPFGLNLGVIVFGVAANLCYSLGPMVEFGIEKLFRGRILPTGPTLFRMGLTFSLGLTFLPVAFAGLDWGFRLVRAIFF